MVSFNELFLFFIFCSNLNGKYLGEDVPAEMAYHGVYWNKFGGQQYSLKSVKMMVRPVE